MSIEQNARSILYHKLKLWEAIQKMECEFPTDAESVELGCAENIADDFCAGIDLPRTEDGFDSKTISRFIAEVCRVHDLKDPRCDCDRETTGPVPNYCRIHDGDYSSWLAHNNID